MEEQQSAPRKPSDQNLRNLHQSVHTAQSKTRNESQQPRNPDRVTHICGLIDKVKTTDLFPGGKIKPPIGHKTGNNCQASSLKDKQNSSLEQKVDESPKPPKPVNNTEGKLGSDPTPKLENSKSSGTEKESGINPRPIPEPPTSSASELSQTSTEPRDYSPMRKFEVVERVTMEYPPDLLRFFNPKVPVRPSPTNRVAQSAHNAQSRNGTLTNGRTHVSSLVDRSSNPNTTDKNANGSKAGCINGDSFQPKPPTTSKNLLPNSTTSSQDSPNGVNINAQPHDLTLNNKQTHVSLLADRSSSSSVPNAHSNGVKVNDANRVVPKQNTKETVQVEKESRRNPTSSKSENQWQRKQDGELNTEPGSIASTSSQESKNEVNINALSHNGSMRNGQAESRLFSNTSSSSNSMSKQSNGLKSVDINGHVLQSNPHTSSNDSKDAPQEQRKPSQRQSSNNVSSESKHSQRKMPDVRPAKVSNDNGKRSISYGRSTETGSSDDDPCGSGRSSYDNVRNGKSQKHSALQKGNSIEESETAKKKKTDKKEKQKDRRYDNATSLSEEFALRSVGRVTRNVESEKDDDQEDEYYSMQDFESPLNDPEEFEFNHPSSYSVPPKSQINSLENKNSTLQDEISNRTSRNATCRRSSSPDESKNNFSEMDQQSENPEIEFNKCANQRDERTRRESRQGMVSKILPRSPKARRIGRTDHIRDKDQLSAAPVTEEGENNSCMQRPRSNEHRPKSNIGQSKSRDTSTEKQGKDSKSNCNADKMVSSHPASKEEYRPKRDNSPERESSHGKRKKKRNISETEKQRDEERSLEDPAEVNPSTSSLNKSSSNRKETSQSNTSDVDDSPAAETSHGKRKKKKNSSENDNQRRHQKERTEVDQPTSSSAVPPSNRKRTSQSNTSDVDESHLRKARDDESKKKKSRKTKSAEIQEEPISEEPSEAAEKRYVSDSGEDLTDDVPKKKRKKKMRKTNSTGNASCHIVELTETHMETVAAKQIPMDVSSSLKDDCLSQTSTNEEIASSPVSSDLGVTTALYDEILSSKPSISGLEYAKELSPCDSALSGICVQTPMGVSTCSEVDGAAQTATNEKVGNSAVAIDFTVPSLFDESISGIELVVQSSPGEPASAGNCDEAPMSASNHSEDSSPSQATANEEIAVPSMSSNSNVSPSLNDEITSKDSSTPAPELAMQSTSNEEAPTVDCGHLVTSSSTKPDNGVREVTTSSEIVQEGHILTDKKSSTEVGSLPVDDSNDQVDNSASDFLQTKDEPVSNLSRTVQSVNTTDSIDSVVPATNDSETDYKSTSEPDGLLVDYLDVLQDNAKDAVPNSPVSKIQNSVGDQPHSSDSFVPITNGITLDEETSSRLKPFSVAESDADVASTSKQRIESNEAEHRLSASPELHNFESYHDKDTSPAVASMSPLSTIQEMDIDASQGPFGVAYPSNLDSNIRENADIESTWDVHPDNAYEQQPLATTDIEPELIVDDEGDKTYDPVASSPPQNSLKSDGANEDPVFKKPTSTQHIGKRTAQPSVDVSETTPKRENVYELYERISVACGYSKTVSGLHQSQGILLENGGLFGLPIVTASTMAPGVASEHVLRIDIIDAVNFTVQRSSRS